MHQGKFKTWIILVKLSRLHLSSCTFCTLLIIKGQAWWISIKLKIFQRFFPRYIFILPENYLKCDKQEGEGRAVPSTAYLGQWFIIDKQSYSKLIQDQLLFKIEI